jgi:hypothetical protein
MISWTELISWVYQNRWWYIPLHVAIGTIAWGWWNFNTRQEIYERFQGLFEFYSYDIDETEKFLHFGVKCALYFLFLVFLITGPLSLAVVLLMGFAGLIKLKRGFKFT